MKDVQDLNTKNYKTLLKKIKWKDINVHGQEDGNSPNLSMDSV